MARPTAGDVLVETLIDLGGDTIFGIPGDGINGVIEALRVRQDRIRFIQVRHEESAAFAACAYAKWTGKLGVCLATSGPGGIHLLNGLYDAKLDGQPVLAITGLQFHDLVHTFTQQDVELDKLFADVAAYNVRIMGPNHVENVVELACRGVAYVTMPVDMQSQPVEARTRTRSSAHNRIGSPLMMYGGVEGWPGSDRPCPLCRPFVRPSLPCFATRAPTSGQRPPRCRGRSSLPTAERNAPAPRKESVFRNRSQSRRA